MKEKIKKIWHYVVLIVSALIILVQSINLFTNLITYNWYGVLIDIVIISLFLYIIWNRFFKKRQPIREKLKIQKGFIQITVLFFIIVGIVLIGGIGYFGINQYINSQIHSQIQKENLAQGIEKLKAEKETIAVLQTQEQSSRDVDIENLQKQIEILKKQPQSPTSINQAKKLTNKEIISKVKPAVVYIETSEGSGSGMIIQDNGLILTNAHVVKNVSSAIVKLSNGQSYVGIVVGRDENVDLALIKINGIGLSVVEFGNSDNVDQGDAVFTLGYPFGLEGDVSFKEGTISRRLNYEGLTWLETSAQIHPGNSGGPLVNEFGQVIGINTLAFGRIIEGIILGESIKLAIPINVAINYLPELRAGRNIIIQEPQYTTPQPAPQPEPSPAPSCMNDTWSCSEWSQCSTAGSQTRTCSLTFNCPLVYTPSPSTTQSCIPPSPISPPPKPEIEPTPTPTPEPEPEPVPEIPIVQDDFNTYTDGSILGQGNWNNYVNGGNFIVQGTTVFEGAKALYNNSSADNVITKAGTPLSNGRQVFRIRTENRLNWKVDNSVYVRVTKGSWGPQFAAVIFKKDGTVAYWDGSSYKNFATHNDNEWTLLEIEWRSSDKKARYRVNNGVWTGWDNFHSNISFTNFDYIGLGFDLRGGSGGVYFDTLY